MALNITMSGFVYMEDGGLSSLNVSYQAYFYKVNGGSSPSKWNNKRIVESTGYWNINLGDGDWLTQDGSASTGDRIIIVFWSPASAERMDACSSLTEWSCFMITLTGASTYTNPVQVRGNICPNLNWTFPDSGLVGQSLLAGNTSTDQYQWDFNGTTMWHRDSWYTTLMTINNVDNTDYDWGDSNQDNNLSGPAGRTHIYNASGDYDVEIVIEDGCGCTVTGTDQIRIYNNPPVPDIAMIPSNPGPNEAVSFRYTGTDVDNTVSTISWLIEDDGIYGDTDTNTPNVGRDDVVPHSSGQGTDWCGQGANSGAFTNPGNHRVAISIVWWDGFDYHTMPYEETYNQQKFSGPAANFIQTPPKADLNSPITFTNTSTNTSRVGLGLPNCTEYDWTWTDDGTFETESDKPYSYELGKAATTANCQVKLCASWSDGWATNYTCVEKDVVFDTIVTVTIEDCYYNLNVIGTSDDGSVTGYGWTVYSGTSISGSWSQTWESPVGMNQNDKKICFTSEGFYKIVGTVYGTGAPTFDDEILYVVEVCPATTAKYNIWDGTGILDSDIDWDRSGYGVETEAAKNTGTYGLDATGMNKNSTITFHAKGTQDVSAVNYDFLRMWMNVKSWTGMTVKFQTVGPGGGGDTLNLSNYIDAGDTNIWQKVMIPLEDFNFGNISIANLNKLILKATGKVDFWLDDVALTMGTKEQVAVAVCTPDMTAHEFGIKAQTAREVKPSMKVYPETQSGPRVINPIPTPRVL